MAPDHPRGRRNGVCEALIGKAKQLLAAMWRTLRANAMPLPAISARDVELVAQRIGDYGTPLQEWWKSWTVLLQRHASGAASRLQSEWALNPVTFARQFNMAHGDANALQAQAVARG